MLPLPLSRRSSVTDGMTTTDSFSRLRRIASRRQGALEAVVDLVSLLIVGRTGSPSGSPPQPYRSCSWCDPGRIDALHIERPHRLAEAGQFQIAGRRADDEFLCAGEHPLGDEDLPRLRHGAERRD